MMDFQTGNINLVIWGSGELKCRVYVFLLKNCLFDWVYALLAESIIIFTDAKHPIKISSINANMGKIY